MNRVNCFPIWFIINYLFSMSSLTVSRSVDVYTASLSECVSSNSVRPILRIYLILKSFFHIECPNHWRIKFPLMTREFPWSKYRLTSFLFFHTIGQKRPEDKGGFLIRIVNILSRSFLRNYNYTLKLTSTHIFSEKL